MKDHRWINPVDTRAGRTGGAFELGPNKKLEVSKACPALVFVPRIHIIDPCSQGISRATICGEDVRASMHWTTLSHIPAPLHRAYIFFDFHDVTDPIGTNNERSPLNRHLASDELTQRCLVQGPFQVEFVPWGFVSRVTFDFSQRPLQRKAIHFSIID
jgi:hypothetical protein